jgi:glycerol-3-phosphate acyltransferase PlsX
MLLGVRGVCIISHGSSRSLAIENAVRAAAEMVETDVVGHLANAIAASKAA